MEKQISFQGVSLNPYGDISPDGELATCVNLQSHGGALRPSLLLGKTLNVSSAAKLILIHTTSSYRHLIFYQDSTLYWADEKENISELTEIGSIENVKSVHAIGNTLSVLSDSGIQYILFKNDNYILLGELPEISLSFALKGAGEYSETSTVSVETIPYADINKDFSVNNQRVITDAVMILANDFIQKKHKEGKFVFPFLLRYAYRMYNGDLIKHSVPILISCINERNIYAQTDLSRREDITQLIIQVIGCYFQLYYKSSNSGNLFQNWSDIIKSIDIFISEPVYTYYPDKLCERFENYGVGNSNYAICSIAPDTESNFKKHGFLDIFRSNNPGFSPQKQISMPYKEIAEITEIIEETSNFYFLASIPCRELSVTLTKINIDSSILGSLSFKERMTDDYDSHDKMFADNAFVYNGRLNLANIKKEVFKGQRLSSVFTYQDDLNEGYGVCTCYIFARINNKDVIWRMPGAITSSNLTIDYFFFPNADAYQAVFVKDSTVITLELKSHPLLNGVYYCSGFRQNIFWPGAVPEETGSRLVDMANVIYTSQVNNPFYFPIEGINTVGTGEIIGLSAITTALSQGQFGSFPLMAFCTDGNYALQVTSEGLFSSVSPMKRDVCTNPDSIIQIDGAIVFISARGAMLANGSDIQCISMALEGVYDDLAYIDSERIKNVEIVPPVDFFQNCMIAYDYPGKRLLFMKKSSSIDAYGWQYDIESMKWQQIDYAGASHVINLYPYSYIQQPYSDGKSIIKKLDSPYIYTGGEQTVPGVLVTRPLKLDSLQLKSISQIRLEGSYSNLQKLWLYASNDLHNWFFIGATSNKRMLLRGRYFKFYRIAVTANLSCNENISGCRIVYIVKPEYRLR